MDWGQVSALHSSYHRLKRGRPSGVTEERWREGLKCVIQYIFAMTAGVGPEEEAAEGGESLDTVLLDRRLGLLSSPSSVSSGLFQELVSAMLDLQSQRPLLSLYVLRFALRQAVLHPPLLSPSADPPPPPAPSSIFSASPTPEDPVSLFIGAVLEACPSLPQATIHEAVSSVLTTVRASGEATRPGALTWLVTRLLDVSLVMARRLAGPIAGGIVTLLTSLELEQRRTGGDTLLGDVDASLVRLLTWLRDQHMRQRSSIMRSITRAVAEAVSSSTCTSSSCPPAFSSAAPLLLLFLLDSSSPDPGLAPLLVRFLHPSPFGDDWATDLLCHCPALLSRLPHELLERSLLLPSLHPQAPRGALASAIRVLCHQPRPPSPPLQALLASLLHEDVLPLPSLLDHAIRRLLPDQPPRAAAECPADSRPMPSPPSTSPVATPSLPLSLSFLSSYVPPPSPHCAGLCSDDALLALRRACCSRRARAASEDDDDEEEDSAAVDPWTRLPAEAFDLILSHLSPRRLAKASLVCRAWAEACRSPLLWRDLYHRKWRGGKKAVCQSSMAHTASPPAPPAPSPAPQPPVATSCSLCGGAMAPCQPTAAAMALASSSSPDGCLLRRQAAADGAGSKKRRRGKQQPEAPEEEQKAQPEGDGRGQPVPWRSVFAARWSAQATCRRLKGGSRAEVCPVVGCAAVLRSALCAKAHRQRHERAASGGGPVTGPKRPRQKESAASEVIATPSR